MTQVEHLGGIDDPLDSKKLEDIVGLCLSGGGFKAAMYHVGSLARLNELGALQKIARISSVSGGAIAAGLLAARWNTLNFKDGVATEFVDQVVTPLINMCLRANIDRIAICGGLLSPFERATDKTDRAYNEWLYKNAHLDDLPKEEPGVAPRFVFNATNLSLNTLVRFSRDHVRDYRVGEWKAPHIRLSTVVAASSAFPPVLSPLPIMPPQAFSPMTGSDKSVPPYSERLELGDGGIYDNLGVETIMKRCKTILVSNAGDPFDEKPDPPDDWYHQMRRTVSMIHRQAENNRMRLLVMLGKLGYRNVALWNLRSNVEKGALSLSEDDVKTAQSTKVRLKPMRKAQATALMRHGYAMCDASVGAFWLKDSPRAIAFPDYLRA